MRKTIIGLLSAAFAATTHAAFAVNAPVKDASGLVLHSTLREFTGRSLGILGPATDVKPGQTLSITGDCVAKVVSADRLRVVLTLADTTATGFRSVVPTEQMISGDTLQVLVPNMPEAANHTFQVEVFLLGEPMPAMCTAGSIRIGESTGQVG